MKGGKKKERKSFRIANTLCAFDATRVALTARAEARGDGEFTLVVQRQFDGVLQQGLEHSVRGRRQEARWGERDGVAGHLLHRSSLHWQPLGPSQSIR